MKTKLHTLLLYPLIIIFSSFLKGKKSEYTKFFTNEKQEINQGSVLKIISNENKFFEQIKYFFDKQSPLYDKTFVEFELDTNQAPEKKHFLNYDFSKVLSIFYTLSMLSARIPNENINVGFTFKKQKLDDNQINHFLRYAFLTYASKKVDKLYFDTGLLKDQNSLSCFETMVEYLNDSTITNFSNAKNLYVITCKKGKKTFDIIWSSSEDIELTEFNKVYDKYGKPLNKDIKISNSPIYAFHK